jgi:hypothetical protein
MTRAIHPAFFLCGALLFCAVWLWSRPFAPAEQTLARRGLAPAIVEPAFIEIDTAVLERYVGKYEGRGDFTAELTLKNGKLVVQAPGIAPFEFRAISETEFFLKGAGVPIKFDVGRDGTVRGFAADTEFGVIKMKRVR